MDAKKVVHTDYVAMYPDPIVLKKGDRLMAIGKRDNWDGHIWIWATAATGKEGWIPGDIILQKDESIVALRDYSANELSCQAGDTLIIKKQDHGWGWCQAENGAEGWVPLRNME